LLNQIKEEVAIDDEELRNNARILQEKLETFKVKIENLTVQPGPVITQYEFVPASGIKVAQIENLADDIALALKAQGVRIIAPIPGRGTVGIEIPNTKPATVRFSSIIKSPKFHNPDIKLPIAMGKSVGGEVYCADLTKMPHLLIAGATGKGKSVGINTIIASLLYRMHPRELKFVIIDPKRVEMALYKSLENHFLAISPDITESIVTEPQNAVVMLKCVVEEMQQRYSVLAAAGQRNIADYNRKAKDGTLKERGGIKHRPMPYIVVVIDELADLMMTAGKDVEEPIVRLAQLARAVGIHCVVATQRPSVDVVTGLIKANFPARIAYQVASRIDSRTILDASGAEHLIGNGDMLFSPGNTPKPLRMQNAFISTDEVEAICEFIGKQRGYSQPYTLPTVSEKRSMSGGAAGGDRDVLFEDAARIFIQLQQASVSTLQRRLRVGYARAARIVDELEMAGIVGPPDGSRGRPVLLQSDSELEAYL
jgi:DNA segregation ATPase FtsK/SpoIIIE, S-DNA-T family